MISILSLISWLVVLLTGLANGAETLASLEQVDDYPLYTMTYSGSYEENIAYSEVTAAFPGDAEPIASYVDTELTWGCSLFAAFADARSTLFGRNFDWQFSPALLLFTDPPGGYASVSMVDIAYLGFDGEEAYGLTERPLGELTPLLSAPYLPFDGMNEHGLTVGMAAVPSGNMRPDRDLETVDSLMVMRLVLDNARTVDEAVAIFEEHNVVMEDGPALHYLIADATGRSVLVEYYDREMVVIPNEDDWHLATNHLRSAVATGEKAACWRYAQIEDELTGSSGHLTLQDGLDLLARVSQSGRYGTQWSIVYGINNGQISVVMGRNYQTVYEFNLDRVEETEAE